MYILVMDLCSGVNLVLYENTSNCSRSIDNVICL